MTEKGAALCIFRGDYHIQVSAFRIAQSFTLSPALAALTREVLARL
jgi:hypothetical protein